MVYMSMFIVVAISVSAMSSLETCWVCDSAVSGYSDCLGNSQDTSALLANHPTWTESCDNGCAKAKFQDNGQIFRGCFIGNEIGKKLCNTPEGVCASDDNSGRRFCLHCCHGNKCNGAGTLTMSLAAAMATILAAIVLKA
ncbi:uncharacterized protein [Asterias amurensis]|uniref:uncharacterized protein n=1 Tax=Asterias amurensis TaxID=7602 RepID=UPI003AB5C415